MASAFRWDPPGPDEVVPNMRETGPDVWNRALEVLDWFVEQRAPGTVLEGTPLGRWREALRYEARFAERYAETGEDIGFGSGSPPRSDDELYAYRIDVYAARLLTLSIRALEGARAAGMDVQVDGSFVSGELCMADQPSAVAQMPASWGTVYVAGCCARAGGEALTVYGNQSEGLDIEWRAGPKAVVRFEAKSRAFEASLPPAKPYKVARNLASSLVGGARDLRVRNKKLGGYALCIAVGNALVTEGRSKVLAHLADWPGWLQSSDRYHAAHGTLVHWWEVGAAHAHYEHVFFPDSKARPPAPDEAWAAFRRAFNPDGEPG